MSNFERIPGNFKMYQVDESLNCVMIELKNLALSEKKESIKKRQLGAINLIAAIRRLPYFINPYYKDIVVHELVDILKKAYDEGSRLIRGLKASARQWILTRKSGMKSPRKVPMSMTL